MKNRIHFIKKRAGSSPLLSILFFVLFWVSLHGIVGCATPSPLSPIAMQASRVQEAVEAIRKGYEQKEETELFLYFDPSLPYIAILKTQIQNDFNRFSMIKMEMITSHIDVATHSVSAGIYWEGRWEATPQAMPIYQSGYALFRFSNENPPTLLEIRGDLPWGIGATGPQ
jgi:hypothetical protein